MTSIFMSHCTADDTFTNRLGAELQSRGYTTWIDHVNIRPGVSWPTVVEEALQQCDVMILVLSKSARQSRHVDREWQAFYDHDKLIFPVMVEECAKPMLLSPLQHVDFTDEMRYVDKLNELLEYLPRPSKKRKEIHIKEENRTIPQQTAPLNPDVLKEARDVARGAADPLTPAGAMRITQILEVIDTIDDQDIPVKESDVLFVFAKSRQTRVYKLREPLIIGWAHETTGTPDVDLLPYNGPRYGVSRRHAMLVHTTLGITLTDLGSTNGTFIGKKRLKPNEPVQLKNKAVIRFGGFVVQLHFKETNNKG